MNERLREIRDYFNLSQRAFAEKVDIKQSTIAMFETGKRELKDIHVNRICTEFSVNEDWLRTGSGEMFNKLSEEDELGIYLGKIGSGKHERIETIIKAYFRLSEESKKGVDDYLDTLFNLAQSQKEQDQ